MATSQDPPHLHNNTNLNSNPSSSSATAQNNSNSKRDFSEEDASSNSPSDPTPTDQAPKRRRTTATGGTSSRGVANLTPEQLAKKRANDREAQRAIRERTKNQIENLERKIRELTQQQPYQELQSVLRQKEIVENENAEIRKRLAGVMSLIQPVVGVGPHSMFHLPNHVLGDLEDIWADR